MRFAPTALRRLWLSAPVLAMGAAIGVVGWGGFNTAMEATNSLEFCVSCHVMRDNVYEEYKKTTHYENRSGVRAICSDCHVPRDWVHKVIRKTQATGELFHWLVGTIDSKEKFEARRHELARSEWDRMRASDSRECRNCHAYSAMDFHKQDAKAASAMKDAMKAGKTCIDCHKGIAHKLPDINAGHRADFMQLAASARQVVPGVGSVLYAIGPAPLHLDGANGTAVPGGEIAPAAGVKVVGIEGERLKVEIAGWLRGSTPGTLYQSLGKRILLAKLSDAGASAIESIETVTDPDTDQEWTRARLIAWVDRGGFSAEIGPLWKVGAKMHADNCAICHRLHPPESVTANDWIGQINAMKRLVRLRDEEVALLQSYLQNHAKEIGPSGR
jgi:trimethylamine-N-oxide reductase cytochrome c-type subunit TorC